MMPIKRLVKALTSVLCGASGNVVWDFFGAFGPLDTLTATFTEDVVCHDGTAGSVSIGDVEWPAQYKEQHATSTSTSDAPKARINCDGPTVVFALITATAKQLAGRGVSISLSNVVDGAHNAAADVVNFKVDLTGPRRCPELAWTGTLEDEGSFAINSKTSSQSGRVQMAVS